MKYLLAITLLLSTLSSQATDWIGHCKPAVNLASLGFSSIWSLLLMVNGLVYAGDQLLLGITVMDFVSFRFYLFRSKNVFRVQDD